MKLKSRGVWITAGFFLAKELRWTSLKTKTKKWTLYAKNAGMPLKPTLSVYCRKTTRKQRTPTPNVRFVAAAIVRSVNKYKVAVPPLLSFKSAFYTHIQAAASNG
ncbi:MAG: hypothetical protein KJO34_05445 [Deltaproteobacteria bacterium]|nr:hypothetical protein [Deltaproteobacteria bacterium]